MSSFNGDTSTLLFRWFLTKPLNSHKRNKKKSIFLCVSLEEKKGRRDQCQTVA